jgi:glyoxylase-like metal-dependent hydrolase (beta-lactamase superfamily II)
MFAPLLIPAHNPSPMTGAGNNTYLVAGANGAAALVDAGVGEPMHLAELDAALLRSNAPLARVFVTHFHRDHAQGAPSIAAAHPHAAFEKYPWPEEDAQYGVAWRPLADCDVVTAGDEPLTVLHTPGHSPDHIALWHTDTGSIFTGDLVVLGSSVMIHASRGGNLSEYMRSLERLRALNPIRLLPAHGPIVDDPRALLTGYIEHRLARERQVLAALNAGRRDVRAIAEYIYDGLDPALLPAARENVRAHLEKLRAEGAAVEEDDGWRLLS